MKREKRNKKTRKREKRERENQERKREKEARRVSYLNSTRTSIRNRFNKSKNYEIVFPLETSHMGSSYVSETICLLPKGI